MSESNAPHEQQPGAGKVEVHVAGELRGIYEKLPYPVTAPVITETPFDPPSYYAPGVRPPVHKLIYRQSPGAEDGVTIEQEARSIIYAFATYSDIRGRASVVLQALLGIAQGTFETGENV